MGKDTINEKWYIFTQIFHTINSFLYKTICLVEDYTAFFKGDSPVKIKIW